MSFLEFDSSQDTESFWDEKDYCKQYLYSIYESKHDTSNFSNILSNEFLYKYLEMHIQTIREFYNNVWDNVNNDIDK